MVAGGALVAVAVVAGQAGHQLLRVLVLHVGQEAGGDGAAEHAGRAAVVLHLDVAVLAYAVGESLGSGHPGIVATPRRPARPISAASTDAGIEQYRSMTTGSPGRARSPTRPGRRSRTEEAPA